MPEWSKGPDCKSGGIAFEGSNPSSPTVVCGRSSMVELQPSKLVVWVRFPSPAVHVARIGQEGVGRGTGSNERVIGGFARRARSGRGLEERLWKGTCDCAVGEPAAVAQLVERFLGK